MKHAPVLRCLSLIVLAAFAAPALRADDALFIGNSYTYGGPEKVLNEHGGVPKWVDDIAVAKGKKLTSLMLAVGGKNLEFHLGQPKTEEDLKLKKWDYVILQGFSTEATHVGKPDEFLKNGETFYKRIEQQNPKTKVILYETWARAKGNEYYTGTSTPKTFVDAAEMNAEIHKNYGELYKRLEAIEPGIQVELAPVGSAFKLCLEKNPDIELYGPDKHHANTTGSYLAALVLYATIYHDSPKGAIHEFFGTKIDDALATKMQDIAEEITAPQRAAKDTK